METTLGEKIRAKDAVRALLDRLPDDCSLDEIIDRLYEIEAPGAKRSADPVLTDAQREELDRRLDAHERDPSRTIAWSDFRRELDE